MLFPFVIATVVGLVYSGTTPPQALLEDETEWDCSNDHAPHSSDNRKFLQSPNGFGDGADVHEATCPTRLQVFTQENGLCRCSYVPELRALLEQECQVRVPANAGVDEYDLLVPSLDRETVDELYVRQSCFNVLPVYVADLYISAGIVPLFFNETGCRCDWVEGVDRSIEDSVTPPAGGECERLIDQNFTNIAVSEDEVGNYISLFPNKFQSDVSLVRGGSAFGQGLSEVIWRLSSTTFVELNIVLRFEAESTGQISFIASNICSNPGPSGGFFDLQFDPSNRQYSLSFFSDNIVTCSVPSSSGVQTVQLKYSAGTVSLVVNNVDCDLSGLNRLPASNDEGRLAFNSNCPLQIGGQVATDPLQDGYGQTSSAAAASFEGVFYRVMVLRNCFDPPQMVQDRIDGSQ